MSTAFTRLTNWADFVVLPDAASGYHYELRDGEVVLVPPLRPIHVYIQSLMVQWLTDAANGAGRAAQEFPYRPAKDLQFWYADVAYIPHEHWVAMRADDYPIYSPPLIVEVLSPSNRLEKVSRQRMAAFRGGTAVFWIVDPNRKIVEVSLAGSGTVSFQQGDQIPLTVLPDVMLPVDLLFS